jgi:broad specificity phosphatase PhoE
MPPKTVLLVRHAESHENMLMQGVARGVSALFALSLPSLQDLKSGVSLAGTMVRGTDECELSENGKLQVEEVRSLLLKRKLDLFPSQISPTSLIVTHSPLRRAKLTCEGLFRPGELLPPGAQIIELDSLREIAPSNPSRFLTAQERIQEFEKWVSDRPEDYFVVVGHSHFFRSMLRVDFKFSNCEVWKAIFLPEEEEGRRWTSLERICGSSTAKATFGAEPGAERQEELEEEEEEEDDNNNSNSKGGGSTNGNNNKNHNNNSTTNNKNNTTTNFASLGYFLHDDDLVGIHTATASLSAAATMTSPFSSSLRPSSPIKDQ